MKKTLTVNLGGTVFHIDEDAYCLLDNYLCNLKTHFRKEAGAEEIVDDIERRISELFAEKLTEGSQVITITDVEQVITRIGKPEEMEIEGDVIMAQGAADDTEGASKSDGSSNTAEGSDEASKEAKGTGNSSKGASGSGHGPGSWNDDKNVHSSDSARRRLFRNPDNKMLGGVISGLAAYLNWDVTLLRILCLVVLILGYGTLVPIYIICWLVIPEASTAGEKLSMRGEPVTLENIGKTVTDGFEKMTNGVNDYMKSDKPRTLLQKAGDAFVMVAGFFLKVCLVIFAIICSPLLFVFGIVFIALLMAAIAVAVGGGAALFSIFPDAGPILSISPLASIVMYITGILAVGIPLVSIVFVIFRQLFNWQPMVNGLKWTLLILWIVSVVIFVISVSIQGFPFPDLQLIRG